LRHDISKPITTPRPQQKSLDYGPLAQERGAQEAFRSGLQALQEGRTNQAVKLLERAAEQGVPRAIWKLAGMYADGDGVKMDKGRADDYCLGLIDFASRYRNPGEAQYYLGLSDICIWANGDFSNWRLQGCIRGTGFTEYLAPCARFSPP
jgi:hypothetical protein